MKRNPEVGAKEKARPAIDLALSLLGFRKPFLLENQENHFRI
jgi:hypothetical protein